MGTGGFSCCTCKNLKQTVYFDAEEEEQKNTNKPKIEESLNFNKNTSRNFNPKDSCITNAVQFKQSELKLECQPQKDDEFDNMFNMLQGNSYNKECENN